MPHWGTGLVSSLYREQITSWINGGFPYNIYRSGFGYSWSRKNIWLIGHIDCRINKTKGVMSDTICGESWHPCFALSLCGIEGAELFTFSLILYKRKYSIKSPFLALSDCWQFFKWYFYLGLKQWYQIHPYKRSISIWIFKRRF